MRIDKGQRIAGFPAVAVRQLMRETLGRPLTLRWVSEVLGCTQKRAETVMRDLEEEGWVSSVGGHLEPSLQGSALAQATAAKPINRHTAERLVAELLDRVEAVNCEPKYAYRIDTAVLFGSYLGGEPRINDVDVGVELVPRYTGDEQTRAEDRSRRSHRPDFRNGFEWAAWPKLEIMRVLKSRSRGLSIQELTELILTENHVVVYSRAKRKETSQCRASGRMPAS